MRRFSDVTVMFMRPMKLALMVAVAGSLPSARSKSKNVTVIKRSRWILYHLKSCCVKCWSFTKVSLG